MSDSYINVQDYLENIADYVREKSGDILSELESDLEELDRYRDLFNDEYDARDAKDYYEEMSDIFDDTYDAQAAREFVDSLACEGIDDMDDFENFKDTLTQEIKDEIEKDNEELEGLRTENAELKAKLEGFENSRLIALNVLDGVAIEAANKTYDELREEARASEEKAYEAGLTDAMILNTPRGEQGIVDINLDGLDEDEESSNE